MMATKRKQDYDKDFYAWAIYNAQLLRAGKLSEVDIEHVAEEIESMGKSEKRELINRLAVLLSHLLKWKFQPDKRSNSWKYTIEEQRDEVLELLEDSPSLNHELDLQVSRAYKKAVLFAATETSFGKETFPKECPFSLKQSLNKEFFPE
jgi:hypothetical protein